MFIETAAPFALGSRVSVTFTTSEGAAEILAQAEVRYQCALEFGAQAAAAASCARHRRALPSPSRPASARARQAHILH